MFATVINCMDGRVQLPVNEYMREKFQVPYIDTITEAGPVAVLANEQPSELWEGINKRVQISVQKHGSKVIGIFAHEDCAGNPVHKEEQIKQLIQAKKKLADLYPEITIVAGWVNENWQVEEVG